MPPPPLPASTYQATGSAQVAGINANGPLSKLTVTRERMTFRVLLLGKYEFTPEQVVSISLAKPWLSWWNFIQIQHAVPDYPQSIFFIPRGGAEKALERIRATGFQPSAPASAWPKRSGIPVRWQALVAVVVIWNALFLAYPPFKPLHAKAPGPLVLLPLVFLFGTCLAVRYFPALQQLVLKPGRRVGEIRPWLNFLGLISGILLTIFTVVLTTAWRRH